MVNPTNVPSRERAGSKDFVRPGELYIFFQAGRIFDTGTCEAKWQFIGTKSHLNELIAIQTHKKILQPDNHVK